MKIPTPSEILSEHNVERQRAQEAISSTIVDKIKKEFDGAPFSFYIYFTEKEIKQSKDIVVSRFLKSHWKIVFGLTRDDQRDGTSTEVHVSAI